MIIAKYPIVHAQKTLIKTTIQKMNDPELGVITISLKKRRQIRKLVILLTRKSNGTNNLSP